MHPDLVHCHARSTSGANRIVLYCLPRRPNKQSPVPVHEQTFVVRNLISQFVFAQSSSYGRWARELKTASTTGSLGRSRRWDVAEATYPLLSPSLAASPNSAASPFPPVPKWAWHWLSFLTAHRASELSHSGASIYDVRNFLGFFYPSPLETYGNQLILFLLSAFGGPPPPPIADVIYWSPLRWTCFNGRRFGHWLRPTLREVRRANQMTYFISWTEMSSTAKRTNSRV